MVDGLLTIGALASASSVGVETIRFYERQGLLAKPNKPTHGFRRYPQQAVERIAFIRRAKLLGFSLDEIRELLDLKARPGAPCKGVRERAIAKLAAIDDKIAELRELRVAVEELVQVCTGSVAVEHCSILGALDGSPETAERRSFSRSRTKSKRRSA